MELKVIYEDNHIIAVEKEAGILTQRDISGEKSLMDFTKDYLKDKYKKPGKVFLGMVHRLDKPVSGIIIFARTSKAARRLHAEFLNRDVSKIYLALVENNNNLNSDRFIELKHYILKRKGYSEIRDSASELTKDAKLSFRLITSNRGYSLLLINLLTGRKHQIRAQMAHIDIPIVGDIKYGSDVHIAEDAICLHSYCLKISHPTKKEMIEIYSEIPERITRRIDLTDQAYNRIKDIIKNKID